jgi:CDP-diacylglycerol--glycerol-3-phosphate 3-phosphatidyltransferase
MIRPLARSGVTPNTLTVIGLILSMVTATVIAQGFLLAGGLLVLFAGIFDMFDGAVARISNTATTFGAFIDSTLDRYSESIILFGLLYYALQRPALHLAFWPLASEQQWMISLIFITVVGSLMVSYAKARAEGLGLECKTGLLARPERVIILAIGLLFSTVISGAVIWALVLLAIFSNVTAIERIVYVWLITSRAVKTEKANPSGNGNFSEQLASQREYSAEDRHMPTAIGMNEATESSVHPVPTSVPPFTGGVQE